jgi:GNAT superfamily N-acetyltransferase
MSGIVTERPASPTDYDTFARLWRELRLPDTVPGAATFANEIAPNAFFLEADAKPAAYGYAAASGDTAWVFHVIVDPACRGRRLGHKVMDGLARRLRAAGCTHWTLNVKPDNEPAIALYSRWGFAPAHQSTGMRIRWADVERLPRGPFVARPLAADGTEDAFVEAATGLFPGQIDIQRKRGDRYAFFVAEDAPGAGAPPASSPRGPAGMAAFDPTFPGAMPFRVASAAPGASASRPLPRGEIAYTLLAAMKTVALPAFDHTRLVVEGDPALLEALRAAGAETLMTYLQMRGAIPPA